MSADVRIQWHLELVGDPSRNLLRQDRQIRSSLTATDRLQRKLATSATQTGRAQARGSQTAATALQREGRAARQTRTDVANLNRAQAEALSAGSRLASNARRVADAYRAQAGAARQASAAERARSRANSLAAGAAGSGAGLTRGVQAGIAAAAGGGIVAKGVSIFAGFEQQMDRVQAVSGATGREMDRLTKQAEDLGARTSFSAREAADGMYQLSTAGFSTREVMRTIPGVLDLAAASGVGLADAAELQASTIRAFGLRAGEAGRVADALATTVNRSAVEMGDLQESLKYVAPVARATGQSMEGMLAAIGLMGNVGVKGSQAGTTLRTALVRLTDPTAKAEGALHSLGIQASDLRGPKGLLPLPKILDKVVRGAQGLDKGTRNAALSRIFGREALSGMVALVEKGPKALNANIRALKASDGQAKRTAKTMRDNVAGGWDEFTGSLETAAITLTKRFGPALKDGLSQAASLTNDAARGAGNLLDGLSAGVHGRSGATVHRGPGGRVESVEGPRGAAKTGQKIGAGTRTAIDEAAKIGKKIGDVAHTIATVASDAGKQLLDAFKPAAPFLRNVLLPLLKGIGEGALGSVVAAFKVLVPVIRVVSTALGWVGEKAKPLRGVFEGIGNVIGFVFGGPILKGIGLLGKLGGVFRLIGAAARIVGAPLRLVGAAAGVVVRGVARVPGALAAVARMVPGAAGRLVSGAARGLSAMPGKLAAIAHNAGRAVLDRLGSVVGGLARLAGRAVSAFVGGIGKLAGKVASIAGSLTSAFVELGKKIVQAIADGIKSAAGSIPGALKDALDDGVSIGGVHINPLSLLPGGGAHGRAGGRLRAAGFRRYQGGGLVPSLVSPGEMVSYGSSSWMVPGTPVARDSVLTALPTGAAVYTSDGQARLAAGESPGSVLATQLPHFNRGGRVQPGRYDSTAYGPPWTGINGRGVTATGVNLTRSPHLYGVAVDPRRIPLGQNVYAWPNPFGYAGRFRAFDTGSAIKGNRLDFYDWRSRQSQLRWGHRDVNVGTHPQHAGGNTYRTPGGRGATPSVRILGHATHRGGLVDDAFAQGIQAGSEGLTRNAIRREGNPIIAAIREQMASAGPTGGSLAERYRRENAGGGRGAVAALKRVATRTRVPYVFGGGHGGFSRSPAGLDCSGYVSHVLHYGGANPDLGAPVTTTGTARYGRAGRGRRVTIHTRTGAPAHTALTIDGRGYSSGNRATGRLSGAHAMSSSYLATLPIKRHPVGMRRGGLVLPRFRTGGPIAAGGRALSRGANRAMTFAGGSLAGLDELLGAAVESRIFALRRAIATRVRAGGPQRVVQRLQSMLDTIDFELGRRIGRIQDTVAARATRRDRRDSRVDRRLRRAGTDPSSAAGLGATIAAGESNVAGRTMDVSDLKRALRTAKRRGDRSTIRTLTGQLAEAQDALSEAITVQIERSRDLIRATAQETADRAQHGVSLAQAGLGLLEAQQRGQDDNPLAMRSRADAIQATLIPALQANGEAIRGQLDAAVQTGDTAGIRAAELALTSNATDLANAVADAAELLRNASVQAAQDVVDTATYKETLASTGLQRLELEQRLAGTFEGGGQQRADYINANVIPALQAELTALQDQATVDRDAGLTDAFRAATEAAAAKTNEILQAQLDAQEAIAANTQPRRFGGTLGFGWAGDTLTDSLVLSGNGF